MVFRKKTSTETRAFVRFSKQGSSVGVNEICRKAGVSRATVHRCLKEDKKHRKLKKCPGWPKLIDAQTQPLMARKIRFLLLAKGGFSSKRLVKECSIEPSISTSTVTRTLWWMGYHYLQVQKKGILTEKDKTARRRFAWDIKKNYSSDLWTKDICFYLDGASFAHKYNPCDQSRAPKGRVWRQTSEGLDTGCTVKGAHVGTGGRVLKLFVAISFRQGVICCEEYERLDGEFLKSFVTEHFPEFLRDSKKGHSCLFIQDGDPRQNSARAQKAIASIGAKLLVIPPRRPDLNPIENVFYLVSKRLDIEVFEQKITCETCNQYTARVKNILYSMDKAVIDNIIASMCRRTDLIVKNKGIEQNINKRNTRKWRDATGTVSLLACYKWRWIFCLNAGYDQHCEEYLTYIKFLFNELI